MKYLSFAAVLTAVSGFIALNAAETEVKFDNRFLSDDKGGVVGWMLNSASEFKPFGETKPMMKDAVPGIQLASKGKYTAIYTGDQIPVKTGETLKLTFKFSGKGAFQVGFYMYGEKAKWQWMGATVKDFHAESANQIVGEASIPIDKENVKNVCVSLAVMPDADVTIYDLKLFRTVK